ncbi:Arginyl-tRNA synthetase [Gracilaria domingensis]|nr:Arginyl-tRNA synthetase [Gracilaria domingensis]
MMTDTRNFLASRVVDAMNAAYGEQAGDDPKLTPATRPDFGDYQCNAAMSLSKKVGARPRDVAAKILEQLDLSGVCEPPAIAGPGFINLTLNDDYVNDKLNEMLSNRSRLGVKKRDPPQRIVVDFSSPNIAKDMHVGHLRSTIIGDTLARILEFLGHTTIRLNHTGDWGTQFGQLITYMKAECPQLLEEGHDSEAAATIGDLVEFYRQAKKCYDEDPAFKSAALAEVVQLQSGNPETLRAWKLICDLSRTEFQKIYDRLDIKLEERGESFYNPLLSDVVASLFEKGLATKNEGATVVFLEGDKFKGGDGKPLPVIVQKSDGGYLYATTDLAAVRYRSSKDEADRILYVTDVGQSLHFKQIFALCRKAQFLPERVSLEHVPFGLVQGADGKKFKTRAGAAPKLSELLDEARDRVRIELTKRAEEDAERAGAAGEEPQAQKSEEEMQTMSEIIGVAAVKYADLQNNRTSNYKFSFDKMVKLEGNTAPYIMYAFARVQGIYRTAAAASGETVTGVGPGVNFVFEKKEERGLSKMLMRLPEVLSELERDLLPHVLCDYVKNVTTRFNQFYEECPVLNASSDELKLSRLALCQISADTLKLCLGLLGIPTLDRI